MRSPDSALLRLGTALVTVGAGLWGLAAWLDRRFAIAGTVVGVLGLAILIGLGARDLMAARAQRAGPPAWKQLNVERERRYREQSGLFLVHTWKPSEEPRQVADVTIKLAQHGSGPLTTKDVDSVEYVFGPRFTERSIVQGNADENFGYTTSMYSPMLCLARVYFKDKRTPITLSRYLDFDAPTTD